MDNVIETNTKREIIILNCKEITCPQVLTFVFIELCGYFERNNYKVKIVNKINELHDNSIVFMGDIFNCDNPAKLLNLYAPNAIYIGWYWQNIDVSELKYYIHTYENALNIYYDKNRINDYIKLTTSKVNTPLLLRANEDPLLIGTYERNIKYDYCYVGWGYCRDLIPTNKFYGIYYGVCDNNLFLKYGDRKTLYLSSIFALGFQSSTNIGHKHVSQRIYEGLTYGCIVLSNSLPACEQTNNIVIYITSLEDLENKMDYYKKNPNEIIKKQKEGYEFAKKFGTNHTSIQKFADLIEKKYNIII
jgi:hypothetical protein